MQNSYTREEMHPCGNTHRYKSLLVDMCATAHTSLPKYGLIVIPPGIYCDKHIRQLRLQMVALECALMLGTILKRETYEIRSIAKQNRDRLPGVLNTVWNRDRLEPECSRTDSRRSLHSRPWPQQRRSRSTWSRLGSLRKLWRLVGTPSHRSDRRL